MIMLVEPAEIKRVNPIAGLWQRLRGGEDISVSEQMVLGMKTLKMTVPVRTERTRKKAAQLLRELRINTVFLREDFPHSEWFELYRQPTGDELIRRMTGVVTLMAAKNYESVCVYARHIDPDGERVVRDLCGSFRHVMLLSDGEGALNAAEKVSGKLGVSVIANPSDRRVMASDAAVILDMPGNILRLGRDCVAVAPVREYYNRVECSKMVTDVCFTLKNGEAPDIPPGFSQKALIFEAILRGGMRFEDICIKSLEISP